MNIGTGWGLSHLFGESFKKGIQIASDYIEDLVDSICACCGLDFNTCRKLSKEVANANLLDLDLDEELNKAHQKTLIKAKTRNGAKTNIEITKYHQSIKHKLGSNNGIYQYHRASHEQERKLVIMLMGNLQSHNDSENQVGLLKLYNELKKEDKYDLLLCRVGSCFSDMQSSTGFSTDDSLNTDVVYEHISNLIEDRCHLRGQFSEDKKPTSIDVVGYSWGGGVQKNLENRWQKISNNETKVRTVCIDGIEYGCRNLGDELSEKPNYTKEHLNIYQNNTWFLNGEKNLDKENHDCFIDVNSIDPTKPGHNQIDDSKPVLEKIKRFINITKP